MTRANMKRGGGQKKRARDEDTEGAGDDSSSSSSESDWRQEVWRRGYQGPLPPWGAAFPVPTVASQVWPMWQQGPSSAAQYQGRQQYRGGGSRAQQYRNADSRPWPGRPYKRQRRNYQEDRYGGYGSGRAGEWEEDGPQDSWPAELEVPEEPLPEDGEEDWPDPRTAGRPSWRGRDRDDSPRGARGGRSFGGQQRRGKGGKRPNWPPPEEEEDDIEPIDPTHTMQMEVVEVAKKYIAKIIGKKGATIRLIREETGAYVDARDQTQDPCQVKVLGTTTAIEAARQKIHEIIDQSINKPGIVLEIPRAKIGKVIGIKGAQIHEIQTSTGAKVDVNKDVDPCKVTVGGTDEQIAAAEKIILTLSMEAADQESEYLDLPSAVSGAVLGVRGARLMELQAASGARIDVDKTRPAMCRVRIAGSPDQIEVAKQLVLLATEAPRPTEATVLSAASEGADPNAAGSGIVDLPVGTAGKIIGRNGATIQSIQSETGARVWVDCESSQARISGQPGAVEHAKLLVQALAEEAETELGGISPAARAKMGVVVPPPIRDGGHLGQLAAQAAAAGPIAGGPAWRAATGVQGTWGGSTEWGPWPGYAGAPGAGQQGGCNAWDPIAAGWQLEQHQQHQQGQEEEVWEWHGQRPEPEGGVEGAQATGIVDGGLGGQEPQEEHVVLPPQVQPKTAMQRAFAMLAARQGGGGVKV